MSPSLRQTLDVSRLPDAVLDERSAAWWGNLLLLLIETTMFGLLVAAYFYLQQNFPQWPPVQPHAAPPLAHPSPRLGPSLLNLAIIAGSCIPMIWADRSALQRQRRGVDLGLALTILFGLAALAVRWQEFHALLFRWDDNAYGSVVWTVLGMHMLHLIVGACVLALMLLWVVCKGLDDKHARDVQITAVYWYWIVGMWVVLWFIVFMSPRLFYRAPNMATDTHPENVPGGNLTLWLELLGPAIAWSCGFELSYAMVPWCCAHDHPLLVQVAWVPFLLFSIALGLLAHSHWLRLAKSNPAQSTVQRSRFMAALGMMSSGPFSLSIVVQGAATCQRET